MGTRAGWSGGGGAALLNVVLTLLLAACGGNGGGDSGGSAGGGGDGGGAAQGAFIATGSMKTPRAGSPAALLPDGKVLVAGGSGAFEGFYLASAELYDPATGTFSVTGNLGIARAHHTATTLADGRVLIAGGETGGTGSVGSAGTASAEIYNPATGTFSATGSMTTPRRFSTATLLADGRVLIAGGIDTDDAVPGCCSLSGAELYDPATGTFSVTGNLGIARAHHTATTLADGRVLIAGGSLFTVMFIGSTPIISSTVLSSAEVYDPATGTFSATGSMTTDRNYHTATLLQNGTVLVAGGLNVASAETYNLATGTFSATGNLDTARYSHTATPLADGKVLIVGGRTDSSNGFPPSSTELYNPATGTFSAGGNMIVARDGYAITRLSIGTVLIAGGINPSLSGSTILASAEIFQ